MKQKYTEELGYQSDLSSLAGWNLKFSQIQIHVSSGNYSTDTSPIVVLCLSSWHLTLSTQLSMLRKTLKRTPMQIYATLPICGFIFCCTLPIKFQLHHLPVLQSPCPRFSKTTMLCWGSSPVLQERKCLQAEGQDAHLFHFVSFVSLREHSPVLKAVISCRLSSFLVVYDVRESLLPLKLPTWLEG